MMGMRTAILAAIAALVLLAGVALAQSGGEYELWGSGDGGGATSSEGGGFALSGTIGQPDAGEMSGGEFTLAGGFSESRALIPEHGVYLPVVMKRHP